MGEWAEAERATCAEADCDRVAVVVLDIPWTDNRQVCPAHARALGQQEGVVAMPIEDADQDWQ